MLKLILKLVSMNAVVLPWLSDLEDSIVLYFMHKAKYNFILFPVSVQLLKGRIPIRSVLSFCAN